MSEIYRTVISIVLTHAVALAIIILVIKRLLLGDTVRAVNRIRQVEAEVRKKEESIRREITEHEKEFARKKAEAEAELQEQREKVDKEISKVRDQMLADAKAEGNRIVEQAKKNEEKFRLQIAQDMEEKAVRYGGEVFRLVMSEEINQDLNKSFINELLAALEQVDAATITVDASGAEFKSSHPIDPEQKKRLEKLLLDKFAVDIKVREKVEPDLLAGLSLKLGSLEIDGTLLSRCREAAAEVQKSTHV
jgi:F0F1-type ATP synthase delta subunit